LKLKVLFLLIMTLMMGSAALAYVDDFNAGINPAWQPSDASWSANAGAYRGSSAGDSSTIRTDWVLPAYWTYEADVTLVSQTSSTADTDLAVYKSDQTLGVLAGITRLNDANPAVIVYVQYVDDTGWHMVLSAGWFQPTPDTVFHIKLERPGYDYLRITVTGDKGFTYSGNAFRIPQALLDSLSIPGLRVYGRTSDFDNVSVGSRVPAYSDDFNAGVSSGWQPADSSWSASAGKYHASTTGDTYTIKTDCVLPSQWVFEADANLVSQPDATCANDLAVYNEDLSLGVLAGFNHFEQGTHKAILLELQYIANNTWHTPLRASYWLDPAADTSYHMKLMRPTPTSDYLVFTIVGNQGTSFTGRTDSIPPAVLDHLTYPGFRIFDRTTDFDNFNVSAAPAGSEFTGYYDNFSSGVDPVWQKGAGTWNIFTDTSGEKYFRGNYTGDSLSLRKNWYFTNSWSYETDVTVRSQYGTDTTVDLAVGDCTTGGAGLLIGMLYDSAGAILPMASYYDHQYGWWPVTSTAGWDSGVPDQTFHIKVDRPAGSNYLVLTITGDKGFLWSGNTDEIPADFLDNLTFPGYHLYGGMLDYDNMKATTPLTTPVYQQVSVANVKTLAEGAPVQLTSIPVSARFYCGSGRCGFAVQSGSYAGIRVISNAAVEPGDLVTVKGIAVTRNGERVIDATGQGTVVVGGHADSAPKPVAMNNRASAGGVSGQQGAVANLAPSSMSVGANNVGLLVKIFGKVTATYSYDHPYEWSGSFYVDDGSALDDGSGNTGIKCRMYDISGVPAISPAPGAYVAVTGVVGVQKINGVNTRFLWTTTVDIMQDAEPAQ